MLTSPTSKVAFEIFYKGKKVSDIDSVSLYALNTLPTSKKLAFVFGEASANSLVIPRSAWGADETIRYVNNPKQIAARKARESASNTTKTHAQIEAIAKANKKEQDIANFINARIPELHTVERITEENGNKLLWPIQRMNTVNKIVIHHTGDPINGRSDEEMLRAIYAYHAITRGWGDIGYNYIVGQSGKIYEGRAGGEAVVGAHAAYNNVGSVGISVM